MIKFPFLSMFGRHKKSQVNSNDFESSIDVQNRGRKKRFDGTYYEESEKERQPSPRRYPESDNRGIEDDKPEDSQQSRGTTDLDQQSLQERRNYSIKKTANMVFIPPDLADNIMDFVHMSLIEGCYYHLLEQANTPNVDVLYRRRLSQNSKTVTSGKKDIDKINTFFKQNYPDAKPVNLIGREDIFSIQKKDFPDSYRKRMDEVMLDDSGNPKDSFEFIVILGDRVGKSYIARLFRDKLFLNPIHSVGDFGYELVTKEEFDDIFSESLSDMQLGHELTHIIEIEMLKTSIEYEEETGGKVRDSYQDTIVDDAERNTYLVTIYDDIKYKINEIGRPLTNSEFNRLVSTEGRDIELWEYDYLKDYNYIVRDNYRITTSHFLKIIKELNYNRWQRYCRELFKLLSKDGLIVPDTQMKHKMEKPDDSQLAPVHKPRVTDDAGVGYVPYVPWMYRDDPELDVDYQELLNKKNRTPLEDEVLRENDLLPPGKFGDDIEEDTYYDNMFEQEQKRLKNPNLNRDEEHEKQVQEFLNKHKKKTANVRLSQNNVIKVGDRVQTNGMISNSSYGRGECKGIVRYIGILEDVGDPDSVWCVWANDYDDWDKIPEWDGQIKGRGHLGQLSYLKMDRLEKVEQAPEPSPFDIISKVRLSRRDNRDTNKIVLLSKTDRGFKKDDTVTVVTDLWKLPDEVKFNKTYTISSISDTAEGIATTTTTTGEDSVDTQEKVFVVRLEGFPDYCFVPGQLEKVEPSPEPSPFDVISRVRLSQRPHKFNVGDKVNADGFVERSPGAAYIYGLKRGVIYTISQSGGGWVSLEGVPRSISVSGGGNWSEDWFVKVEKPEPSPFDVISKVKLSSIPNERIQHEATRKIKAFITTLKEDETIPNDVELVGVEVVATRPGEIDVVAEYQGTMTELDAGVLNSEGLDVNGTPINIIPTREKESGNIKKWTNKRKFEDSVYGTSKKDWIEGEIWGLAIDCGRLAGSSNQKIEKELEYLSGRFNGKAFKGKYDKMLKEYQLKKQRLEFEAKQPALFRSVEAQGDDSDPDGWLNVLYSEDNEFKVGNRVRCVYGRPNYLLIAGTLYTISYADDRHNVMVEGDTYNKWDCRRFELVEDQEPEPSPFDVISKVKLSQYHPVFKVGDKVRCIDNSHFGTNGGLIAIGDVFTVKNTWGGGSSIVLEGRDGSWSPEYWELALPEPSPFDITSKVRLSQNTKDIKVGDTVHLTDEYRKTLDTFSDMVGIVTEVGSNQVRCDAWTIFNNDGTTFEYGRGGEAFRNIEKYKEDPEPSPFDITSKVRLSQQFRNIYSKEYEYKVHDKLRCIEHDERGQGITYDKIYEALSNTDGYPETIVDFMDDFGNLSGVFSRRFQKVEDATPSPFDVISRVRLSKHIKSQNMRTVEKMKELSESDRDFTAGESVVIVMQDPGYTYPPGFVLGKTPYTIKTVYYNRDEGCFMAELVGFENLMDHYVGELEPYTKPEPSPFDVVSSVRLSRGFDFQIGDKVMLDEDWFTHTLQRGTGEDKQDWLDDCELELGKVYTVSEVGGITIGLKEIQGSHGYRGTGNYGAVWFKKADPEPSPFDVVSRVRLSQNADDIEVGDTVECIDSSAIGWEESDYTRQGGVKVGKLYKVTVRHSYNMENDDMLDEGEWNDIDENAIQIERIDTTTPETESGWWYHIGHFRKVNTKPEPSPFDVVARVRLSQTTSKFKEGDMVHLSQYFWDNQTGHTGYTDMVGEVSEIVIYDVRTLEMDKVQVWSKDWVLKYPDREDKHGGRGWNREIELELLKPEPPPFDIVSRRSTKSTLLTEVSKYNTVDDFINAHKEVYHGTDKDFEEFKVSGGVRGAFFTDSKERAQRYGNVKVRYLDLHNVHSTDFEGYYWDIRNGRCDGIDDIADRERHNRYACIEVKNIRGRPDDMFTSNDYVVFDNSIIKTREQLVAMYNQNKGVAKLSQLDNHLNIGDEVVVNDSILPINLHFYNLYEGRTYIISQSGRGWVALEGVPQSVSVSTGEGNYRETWFTKVTSVPSPFDVVSRVKLGQNSLRILDLEENEYHLGLKGIESIPNDVAFLFRSGGTFTTGGCLFPFEIACFDDGDNLIEWKLLYPDSGLYKCPDNTEYVLESNPGTLRNQKSINLNYFIDRSISRDDFI